MVESQPKWQAEAIDEIGDLCNRLVAQEVYSTLSGVPVQMSGADVRKVMVAAIERYRREAAGVPEFDNERGL